MKILPKGRGKGKLLREDLRALPGDLVTDDIEDESKIHELDPDHVQADILADYGKEHREERPEQFNKINRTLSQAGQWGVDQIRLRVLRTWLGTQISRGQKGNGPDLGVKHLWFPDDNLDRYGLRDGNPPADVDRPKHMRGLRLEIDLCDPAASIAESLRIRGHDELANHFHMLRLIGQGLRSA